MMRDSSLIFMHGFIFHLRQSYAVFEVIDTQLDDDVADIDDEFA